MKSMKRFFCGALVVFATTSSSSFAIEAAFINMKSVFDSYYKTKDADATLNTQRESMKAVAENMVKEIESLHNQYLKLREEAQNVALSKPQRDAKFEEMKRVQKAGEDKKKEIDSYQKESIKKIKERYEVARDKITKEILDYLANFSEKKGYDLILDVSGQTANGISAVIYYNSKKDITTAVIKRLNLGHEEEPKSGK